MSGKEKVWEAGFAHGYNQALERVWNILSYDDMDEFEKIEKILNIKTVTEIRWWDKL